MTQRKKLESDLHRVPLGPCISEVFVQLYTTIYLPKQNGGDLILRIEDTDSQRFVPGAEAYIIEALTWLGIKFDEGVELRRRIRALSSE